MGRRFDVNNAGSNEWMSVRFKKKKKEEEWRRG